MNQKVSYKYMRLLSRIPLIRSVVSAARNIMAGNKFQSVRIGKDPVSYIEGYDTCKVNEDLNSQGLSVSLTLDPATVQEIFDYIKDQPVFALRDPKQGFNLENKVEFEKMLGKEVLLAQYFNIEENESISRIANSPLLLSIAQKYLGNAIHKVGTIMWWTFPANVSKEDKHKHAHVFHRDIDDYKFLKVFFYLTKVNQGDGSHVFVLESHKPGYSDFLKEGLRIRRYNDTEIEERYGKSKVRELLGDPGSGFAEDTTGFHKANTPVHNPRLALEVTFAQADYGVMHDNISKSDMIVHC